jgi:hypothetical protein
MKEFHDTAEYTFYGTGRTRNSFQAGWEVQFLPVQSTLGVSAERAQIRLLPQVG